MKAQQGHPSAEAFAQVDAKLRGLGVDVGSFGYYDQPAFVALEQSDALALEFYSAWVLNRARDAHYDRHARETVPRLAGIVEQGLARKGGVGACVNVATMMARMLDRLGVWSFAVRGSLTIEMPSRPDVGRRYFTECDALDHPDNVTGHGWLVAPPFLVVDPTLRHQRWVELHPAIAAALPNVVAAEQGEIVRPRWFDVVSDVVVKQCGIGQSELNDALPYRFHKQLSRVEKSLPGRDVRVDTLSLRYIAGSVTISERHLEELPSVSYLGSGFIPIEIWLEEVAPAFGVSGKTIGLP
jgi:hypothetical protein